MKNYQPNFFKKTAVLFFLCLMSLSSLYFCSKKEDKPKPKPDGLIDDQNNLIIVQEPISCPTSRFAWVQNPFTTKVQGGDQVSIDEVPFMARLEIQEAPVAGGKNIQCTGSILSKKWILTAVHCEGKGIKVFVGHDSPTFPTQEYTEYEIEDIVPLVDPSVIFLDSRDLLLLKVKDGIQFTDKIAPIIFQDQYIVVTDNFSGKADYDIKYLGWAKLNTTDPKNPVPFSGTLSALIGVKDAVIGLSWDGNPNRPRTIQTEKYKPGGSVSGDSGSPVVMPFLGSYYQVAVLSTGSWVVADDGSITSITNRSTVIQNKNHLDWIMQTTGLQIPKVTGATTLNKAETYNLTIENTALDTYKTAKAWLLFEDQSALQIPITLSTTQLEADVTTDILEQIPNEKRKQKAHVVFEFNYGGSYNNRIDLPIQLDLADQIVVVPDEDKILYTIQEDNRYAKLLVIQKKDGFVIIENQNPGYSLSGGTENKNYTLKEKNSNKTYLLKSNQPFCVHTDTGLKGDVDLEEK